MEMISGQRCQVEGSMATEIDDTRYAAVTPSGQTQLRNGGVAKRGWAPVQPFFALWVLVPAPDPWKLRKLGLAYPCLGAHHGPVRD